MIWGYGGVFPGEFGIWQGDVVMNKLKFMVDQGFESTGLGLNELRDPARRDQIAKFVGQHRLKIMLHVFLPCITGSDDEVARATETILREFDEVRDLLAVPLVHTGAGQVHRFMDKPGLDEQLDRLARGLEPLGRELAARGMRLGIENHGDYYLEDLVELHRRAPHVGIFVDTGNCYLIGEQTVRACRAAAPYAVGTHFKDHRVAPNPKELKFEVGGAALGEGHVGLAEIYRDLLALNPDPDALVMHWELVPPKGEDPWMSLEKSRQFVKRLVETKGQL